MHATGMTWTSSRPDIATVSAAGVVTGDRTRQRRRSQCPTPSATAAAPTVTVRQMLTLSLLRQRRRIGQRDVGSVRHRLRRDLFARSFVSDSPVTLTATPAPNSTFTGWTGCDSVSGATCTVNDDQCAIGHRDLHAEALHAGGREDRHRPRDRDVEPAGHQLRNRLLERLRGHTVVTLTASPALGSAVHGLDWLRRSERIHLHGRHERDERSVSADFLGVPFAVRRRGGRAHVQTRQGARDDTRPSGNWWSSVLETTGARSRWRRRTIAAGSTACGDGSTAWREERTIVQALRGVPRNGTVLDAACGTGRITALLQQEGFRASGCDVSPAMMAVARQRLTSARLRRRSARLRAASSACRIPTSRSTPSPASAC